MKKNGLNFQFYAAKYVFPQGIKVKQNGKSQTVKQTKCTE